MTAEDIREFAKLVLGVVERVPYQPIRGSARDREAHALRSMPGQVGLARSGILDLLSIDMQAMGGQLALILDGVADVLAVAATRDNNVNAPCLGFVVRPALELAGQVAWLLGDQITGEERSRRYLVWRLADLRAQRLLLMAFEPSDDLRAAHDALDQAESDLLLTVETASWAARRTTVRGVHVEAAALLKPDGSAERIPALAELVSGVSSRASTYGFLSVTNHSHRFGVLHGIEVDDADDDNATYYITGSRIDIDLMIGLGVVAGRIAGRVIGGWNGLDTSDLDRVAIGSIENIDRDR